MSDGSSNPFHRLEVKIFWFVFFVVFVLNMAEFLGSKISAFIEFTNGLSL